MNYLIYSSRKKAHCDDREIERILASCKNNNVKLDITGILIHSNKFFLQYLEGSDPYRLMKLYDQIRLDDRHYDVMLLHKGEIPKRYFPDWYMGCKALKSEEFYIETDITKEDLGSVEQMMQGQTVEGIKPLEILAKFYRLLV